MMTNRVQDVLLAVVLLVISGTWTWLVVANIPPGFGEGEVGPRAFPLVLGIALFLLAGILLVWPLVFRSKHKLVAGSPTTEQIESEPADVDAGNGESTNAQSLQWIPALLVLVEILLYGYLLEKIGFLLATPIVVLIVMIVSLRIFSVTKLLATALGLTVGCWLVFEKIMGIYLAKGTWLNLG